MMEAQRRSSSRSIKRKKFDDELVDSSPTNKKVKSQLARNTSGNSQIGNSYILLSPLKHELTKRRISRSAKKSGKGRGGQMNDKGVGRWKPADDYALILGVLKTNDLKACRGIKFSCKFTYEEIKERWHALLFDSTISKVSTAAIRNLHPMIREEIQAKALFSEAEEQLLSDVSSKSNPNLDTFSELLQNHIMVFGIYRTAEQLHEYWKKMKNCKLLNDQTDLLASSADEPVVSFSDMEEAMQDWELLEPVEERMEQELNYCDRINQRKIKLLEEEVYRWERQASILGNLSSPDFDNETLAVLRGTNVKYLMRSREITLGRSTCDHHVDIDLSLEGHAVKVSRRQGVISLTEAGDFHLLNTGKRPIYINGYPVLRNERKVINDNNVMEVADLTFIFRTNQDLVNAVQLKAARLKSIQ